jgi:hypothetical protein
MTDNGEADLASRYQFSRELLIIDISGRLGEQQSAFLFQSADGFADEWA